MRFVVFALLFFVKPAFAAGEKSPVQPAVDPATVKRVLLESAHNGKTPLKWFEIDSATRATIVDSWLRLDETTRPPFPLYAAEWQRNGQKPAEKSAGAKPVKKR